MNTPESLSMSCTKVKNSRVANSFQLYLREIAVGPRLTAVEETDLAVAIAQGDKEALARMIQANLLLVVTIARTFLGRGLSLDDLVGEGNLGLIRGAQDFQPRYGTRFSTYAVYWIKQSIRHALINTTAAIRLPAYLIVMITKLRRAERALRVERGQKPSFDEVASVVGLSEAQKKLIASAIQALRVTPENNFALERRHTTREDIWNLDEEREASIEVDDDCRVLLQRMQRLDDRERTILELHYGLCGNEAMTLKEIGRRLGITREWARKIEHGATRKLSRDAAEPGRSLWEAASAVTSPGTAEADS
jgi:RNA polymerase primary sigma factor